MSTRFCFRGVLVGSLWAALAFGETTSPFSCPERGCTEQSLAVAGGLLVGGLIIASPHFYMPLGSGGFWRGRGTHLAFGAGDRVPYHLEFVLDRSLPPEGSLGVRTALRAFGYRDLNHIEADYDAVWSFVRTDAVRGALVAGPVAHVDRELRVGLETGMEWDFAFGGVYGAQVLLMPRFPTNLGGMKIETNFVYMPQKAGSIGWLFGYWGLVGCDARLHALRVGIF